MTIKDELLALKNDDGLIIPEQALDWAQENPDSALHKSLQWDDQKAAHNYRIWQVRQLIAIHVVTEEGDRKLVSLSIDRTKDRGGYRDVSEVIAAPDLRKVLLEDALKELERMEGKYNRVKELADVWEAAHRVRTRQTQRNSARHGAPSQTTAA